MKKTNIIVGIIVVIIIVGIFSNALILRHKYVNGDFESAKGSISMDVSNIKSIHVLTSDADTVINANNCVNFFRNDSMSGVYPHEYERLFDIKGNNLICNNHKWQNVKIDVAELTELEIARYGYVWIRDFVSKELNVIAENGAIIRFVNCEIEVLNVIAANAANVSVDSACVIKTLYVNLSTKATFSAETSCAEEFNYIVYDDCFLEVPEGMRKK